MTPARCSNTQVDRIRALERELGGRMVAYEKRPVPAVLSEEQFMRLHALEEELGLVLVIYQPESDSGR